MRGEAEVRVGVEGFEEGLVAAQVRILDHFREIAHRLVGVDAEEQGYCVGHLQFSGGAAHGAAAFGRAATGADRVIEAAGNRQASRR
jgi:hypothetical protein